MGCHLDGAPVLHHDDAVGALGRREAVRDRDDRSARGDRCERALDRGLGRRVEARRRFVQHDHSRVRQRDAGDPDELALAR